MERRALRRCLFALTCAAVPAAAKAQAISPARPAGFDLRAVAGKSQPDAAGSPRIHDTELQGETGKPEKVKLRLTYQPDDEGPRFEIGTLGSRKGAMKSRLLHVAMDWDF